MVARRGRRATRGARDLVWTTVLTIDEDIAANATSTNEISVASDWTASDGFERATLLAIRGFICVGVKTQGGIEGGWVGYIAKMSAGETKPDPLVAATYEDEDILWTGGGLVQIMTTGNGQGHNYNKDISVKVKRKIDVNTVITCQIRSVVSPIRLSLILRALLDRG